MTTARIPLNEELRLKELYRYELLDTPPEEEFNEIATLASQICKTPVAAIILIDKSRQWAKAAVGVTEFLEHRDFSFCSHTILANDLMQVQNTSTDERFFDNPLVKEYPHVCFYAGVPLKTSNGFNIGSICVIDTVPRTLTDEQSFALKVLSKQTVRLIEMRLLDKEVTHYSEIRNRIISVMSHDIRSPLSSIKTFLDLDAENAFSAKEREDMMYTLSINVNRTLQLLDNLVEWSKIQLHSIQKKEVLNVQAIVQECIDQAELNAILKQNKFLNFVGTDILINADKDAIQFILRNLLSNANKFTENGTIQISFIYKNEKCYLEVKDNGVGIAMERVAQILDNSGRFHTNGTQNEKGSGLGLSMIKSYLNKTGHDIEIKSIVKHGTSVGFSICHADELISVLA